MKKIILIFSITICFLTSFSQEIGTFTDPRDGKVYKTVKLGTQTWFAKNLSYRAGSGCWAYDNKSSNIAKYGYLYNWETAKTVCPKGWHLPSDAEWASLINFLGGDSVAGGKMKATTDWLSDAGGNATNESGFNALPAGYRGYGDGSVFGDLGRRAFYWSSTPNGSMAAWYWALNYNHGKVGRGANYRTDGKSVRCIKD